MASGDAADKGKVPQRFGTARLRTGPGPPAGRRAGRTTILCQEFLPQRFGATKPCHARRGGA